MNSNLSLDSKLSTSLIKTSNNFKTYFIHIKKSDINDLDDINMIKNLLDNNLSVNTESVQITDFKFINKTDLKNKSHKNIGKYLKSNKTSTCVECNILIPKQSIFKELNCNHRFHVNCIDLKLKKDLYKKCPKCCSEHISCLV